jgi:hypothetical protein
MAYLSSRRRVCVGVGAVGPADDGMVPVVSPMGVSADLVGGESDAARMMGLSSMLRLGATRCLAVACRNPEETRSDAALGATMAVTLIDVNSSLSTALPEHTDRWEPHRSSQADINGLGISIWRRLSSL